LQSQERNTRAKNRDNRTREPAAYTPISPVTAGSPSPHYDYLDVPVLGVNHKLLLPAAAVPGLSDSQTLHRNYQVQLKCHTAVKTAASN
jgi:hypothetical protein